MSVDCHLKLTQVNFKCKSIFGGFYMKWIYLLIAGALEITWAVAMKMSNGFTVLIPSIVTGVGYIASDVFLAIALR